jgi:hypothetical protein
MLRSGGRAEISLNMVPHPTTLVYNALISFLGFFITQVVISLSTRTVFDQIQLRILIWSVMKSLEDCASVNVQSLVNSHCR